MTVVAVKVKQKTIEIASDSQVTYGWRMKHKIANYSDKQANTTGKIFETNGMVIGGAGVLAQLGLLRMFSKTHKPKEMDIDSIVDWVQEYKEFMDKKAKIHHNDADLEGIIISENIVFAFNTEFDVYQVTDFGAIGSGRYLALGAMECGAEVDKAVIVASKYDLFCGESVEKIVVDIKK